MSLEIMFDRGIDTWAVGLTSSRSGAEAPLEHTPLPVEQAPWLVDYELDEVKGARLQEVLPDRAWAWYVAAREARWAQMKEQRRPDGSFELVADEQKRELAAEDARQLRARLAKALAEGAEEDGDPWPPEASSEEE